MFSKVNVFRCRTPSVSVVCELAVSAGRGLVLPAISKVQVTGLDDNGMKIFKLMSLILWLVQNLMGCDGR